jgi:hypothetical protein
MLVPIYESMCVNVWSYAYMCLCICLDTYICARTNSVPLFEHMFTHICTYVCVYCVCVDLCMHERVYTCVSIKLRLCQVKCVDRIHTDAEGKDGYDPDT